MLETYRRQALHGRKGDNSLLPKMCKGSFMGTQLILKDAPIFKDKAERTGTLTKEWPGQDGDAHIKEINNEKG